MATFIRALIFSLLITESMAGQSILPVGTVLANIELETAKKQLQFLPDFGQKVVIVFYVDPDKYDINDPVCDAIENSGIGSELCGIGVVNCADTWIPDGLIRMGIRMKAKQYEGAIILLDYENKMAKDWNLGNCDDASVIIIIGKDRKVKFFKPVKSEEESEHSISDVLAVLKEELYGRAVAINSSTSLRAQ